MYYGHWLGKGRRPRTPRVKKIKIALICRDDTFCHWCGLDMTWGEMTLDHLNPVSLGGNNHLSNLVLSCCDCNHDRGNAGAGMMRITENNYPKIFEFLFCIVLANGGINRDEPAPEYFDIPDDMNKSLPAIERGLKTLNLDELSAFVDGEQNLAESIAKRSDDLTLAYNMGNAFFEGWPEKY